MPEDDYRDVISPVTYVYDPGTAPLPVVPDEEPAPQPGRHARPRVAWWMQWQAWLAVGAVAVALAVWLVGRVESTITFRQPAPTVTKTATHTVTATPRPAVTIQAPPLPRVTVVRTVPASPLPQATTTVTVTATATVTQTVTAPAPFAEETEPVADEGAEPTPVEEAAE